MIAKPEVVVGASIVDAWRAAAGLLLKDGDRFNLIVHVPNPVVDDEKLLKPLDPRRVDSSTKSLYDVANTIFPRIRGNKKITSKEFLAHFSNVYARGKSRTPNAWGTYFQRLTQFGADGPNQLLRIIDCLNNWNANPRAAFVMHLSGAHLDKPRPLGAPCWQYGQLIRTDDDSLSLSVVYRSHDYFEKALGNFLGLSRLLRYVCENTGRKSGTLTCLSTYAYLGGKKAHTSSLLSE